MSERTLERLVGAGVDVLLGFADPEEPVAAAVLGEGAVALGDGAAALGFADEDPEESAYAIPPTPPTEITTALPIAIACFPAYFLALLARLPMTFFGSMSP
jgi:hypothetical protein